MCWLVLPLVWLLARQTGHLALHLAAQFGSFMVAAQMVDRGVSMHEREAAGRSVLEIARAYGHYRLATDLLGVETRRREAAERARVRGVKTRIAAEIAAKKAQEEYERKLRRVRGVTPFVFVLVSHSMRMVCPQTRGVVFDGLSRVSMCVTGLSTCRVARDNHRRKRHGADAKKRSDCWQKRSEQRQKLCGKLP